MSVQAIFFDGEIARDRPITLDVSGGDLVFSGEDVPQTRWSIAGLHPVDPPSPGQPFRLTHQSRPGARLVIRDADFVQHLTETHKHLKGGYSWLHLRQVAGWTVGGALALAAIGYRTFQEGLTPNRVTFIGWNLINTGLLAYLLVKQYGKTSTNWLSGVHQTFGVGALLYAAWSTIVVFGMPWLF
jgi:hypothetical protein